MSKTVFPSVIYGKTSNVTHTGQ